MIFWLFHVHGQLLGPKKFSWATKIVILGSPAGNSSNNAKFDTGTVFFYDLLQYIKHLTWEEEFLFVIRQKNIH